VLDYSIIFAIQPLREIFAFLLLFDLGFGFMRSIFDLCCSIYGDEDEAGVCYDDIS
jgi:hypothetical protein